MQSSLEELLVGQLEAYNKAFQENSADNNENQN